MLMDNTSFNDTTLNEYAPAKSSKQGGKILATAIIALLVGGAIASAIFLTINNLNGQKSDTGKEIANNGVVLDARLTAELAYKTNRILAHRPSSERGLYDIDTTGEFQDYANLSNQMRADAVIRGYESEEIDSKDLPDSYDGKKFRVENGFKKSYIIRVNEKVKSDYKYLFGKEFTVFPKSVPHDYVSGCPADYLSDESYYVMGIQCGGTTTTSYSTYQYKYELDGDKAYVYLAVMAEGDDDAGERAFYSGFEPDSKIITGLTADQKMRMEGRGVGEEIYDVKTDSFVTMVSKVQHYRAVFEKGSDGDFYYKTLEKVND